MPRGKNQNSLKHDVTLAEVTEPGGTPKGISEPLSGPGQDLLMLLRLHSKRYHLLDSPIGRYVQCYTAKSMVCTITPILQQREVKLGNTT